jgi:hypothetical protein
MEVHMNCQRTQVALIRRYLHQRPGRQITPGQALKVAGTMKLSTRMGELRKAHPDEKYPDKWVTRNGRRVKAYWLNG